MLTTSAEHDRPQPFTALDRSDWGSRPKGSPSVGLAVPSATLFRLAAAAGVGSALILLINAAKRSGIIETTDLTQLLAPLAEIMALGLLIGLFLAFGRRIGLFGTIAFVSHFVALASLEGVEVVINLVFSKLPVDTITELRDGPLGLVLTVTSLLFLFSTLAFVLSLVVERSLPRIPLALYAIGAVPIALRALMPELVLDLGLVSLAAGIAWLSGWMWMRASTLTA